MRKKGNIIVYLRLREMGMIHLYRRHMIVLSRKNFVEEDWMLY